MKLSPLILLLAVPCLGQTTNCLTPPAGLVSWWRGEGNGNDSFGTNNGTVINSVYFEPGMVGNCFHFVSGPNPRIYVPDNPSLVLTNSLTIEAWIKINFGYGIVNRGDDVAGEVPYALNLVGLTDTRMHFTIRASTMPIDDAELYTAPLPTNVWLHVAGTLDDASGDLRIYVNGEIAAETTTSIRATCPLTGANRSLCIGNAAGSAGFPFDGWIDEVSLYSRALSQAEIQAIYNAGSAGKCPPAVGVSLGTYPGLTLQGTTGTVVGIQYTTNVAPNSTWLTLTQFTLTQPIQKWFDADNNISIGSNPRRFYRVVNVP